MDGDLLGVFRVRGCVHRIFQYVRKPDHHRADHAVDVFLHVLHFAGWRTEHADFPGRFLLTSEAHVVTIGVV